MSNEGKNRLKTYIGRLVLAALVGTVAVAAAQSRSHPQVAAAPEASAASESQPFEGTQQP
jgi:hypothetical protein